jgi:hypothetical protein
VVNADAGKLPDQPGPGLKGADPLNLFIVVETGDHHVSVLDGDKLERLHRFPSRYALHGGPKFSPDGRFVYFASRDGWITKFDIYNLLVVAEIRAGLNTRNAAVSGDGKWVMIANYLPHSLVLLDAKDLSLVKIIPTLNAAGDKTSRVSAVYDAAPRKSFVAALKDVPEAWEISYDPDAAPVAEGLVHDFQYQEGHFTPGMFYPQRTMLKDYLDDFFFTQSYGEILGCLAFGKQGTGDLSRRPQEDRRPRPTGNAASWLGNHLAVDRPDGSRADGHGLAEPQRRGGDGHRSRDLRESSRK